MSSDTRIRELVYVLQEQARDTATAPVPAHTQNIFDEMTFLTTDDCHFLTHIFERFPRVRSGFNNMLGVEPEERLNEAVRLLSREPRRGYIPMGVPQGMIQSVAGHQADGMKIAFMVAAGAHDPKRIARMIAVHDLAESVTGDFISGGANKDDITKSEKQKLERIAMRFLLAEFPDEDNAAEMMSLWEEYEEGRTVDAIMAHDIDKLELVMQAQYYESLYPDLKEPLQELWDYARLNMQTQEARTILDEIVAQHPRPHPLKAYGAQVFTFPWPL